MATLWLKKSHRHQEIILVFLLKVGLGCRRSVTGKKTAAAH